VDCDEICDARTAHVSSDDERGEGKDYDALLLPTLECDYDGSGDKTARSSDRDERPESMIS
jgi:hypothetical protein